MVKDRTFALFNFWTLPLSVHSIEVFAVNPKNTFIHKKKIKIIKLIFYTNYYRKTIINSILVLCTISLYSINFLIDISSILKNSRFGFGFTDLIMYVSYLSDFTHLIFNIFPSWLKRLQLSEQIREAFSFFPLIQYINQGGLNYIIDHFTSSKSPDINIVFNL